MKLHSSATLFACVSPAGSVFAQLLDKYFEGKRDEKTLRLIGGRSCLTRFENAQRNRMWSSE